MGMVGCALAAPIIGNQIATDHPAMLPSAIGSGISAALGLLCVALAYGLVLRSKPARGVILVGCLHLAVMAVIVVANGVEANWKAEYTQALYERAPGPPRPQFTNVMPLLWPLHLALFALVLGLALLKTPKLNTTFD